MIYYKDLKPLNIYSRKSEATNRTVRFLVEKTKKVSQSKIRIRFYARRVVESSGRGPFIALNYQTIQKDGILQPDGQHVCEVPTIVAGIAFLKFLSDCGI